MNTRTSESHMSSALIKCTCCAASDDVNELTFSSISVLCDLSEALECFLLKWPPLFKLFKVILKPVFDLI